MQKFDDERMEESRRRVSEQTRESFQFALDAIHDMALQAALFERLNDATGN